MMTSFSPEPVRIDLETSRSARAFGRQECFWNPQISAILRQLHEHQDILCRNLPDDAGIGFRPNLSFAILGGRGSGKSSLVETVIERINQETGLRTYVLPKLVPSLLSKHDNLIHGFLAALLDELDELAGEKGHKIHELSCRRTLQGLADHLWVINGSSTVEEDRVARGLDQLDRHRSGPLLQKKLETFLDDVAADLGKLTKARDSSVRYRPIMILPVDDPDIAFDHFREILEHYRRYLRHSYLVPIFAFSKDLALTLLTSSFCNKLGVSMRPIRTEISESDLSSWKSAADLGHHFLDKLFPSRSRVSLELPQRELLEAECRYRILDSSGNGYEDAFRKRRAFDLLRESCGFLFGNTAFAQLILPESLRRQLQLLDGFAQADRYKVSNLGLYRCRAEALLQVHSARLADIGIAIEQLYGLSISQRRTTLLRETLAVRGLDIEFTDQPPGVEALLLSLLAAETFRPVKTQAAIHDKESLSDESRDASFEHDCIQTLEWFLDLLLAFYVPLRYEENQRTGGVRASLSTAEGLRWNVESTARNIVTGLQSVRLSGFPGVLFLHSGGSIRYSIDARNRGLEFSPGSYVKDLYRAAWKDYSFEPWLKYLRKISGQQVAEPDMFPGLAGLFQMADPKLKLLLGIWCNYGNNPRPWAAISLWRVAGLLSQILDTERREEKFEEVILKHLKEGFVTGEVSSELTALAGSGGFPSADEWEAASMKAELSVLKSALWRWRTTEVSEGTQVGDWNLENVIGLFHAPIASGTLLTSLASLKGRVAHHQWSAGTVVKNWIELLIEYWNSHGTAEAESAANVLASCPLLRLFPAQQIWEAEGSDLTKSAKEEHDSLWQTDRLFLKSLETDTAFVPQQGRETRVSVPVGISLEELLNLLVPADYTHYFDRFRRTLPTVEGIPSRML